MKQLAFAFMLVSVVAQAQSNQEWTLCMAQFYSADDYQEFSWKIHHQCTAVAYAENVMAAPYNLSGEPVQTWYFFLPEGCSNILLKDIGGNGNGGTFKLYHRFYGDWQLAFETVEPYAFNSEMHIDFQIGTAPCLPCGYSCPSDINGDGLVGVGDLIIFMAEYGSTCN